MNRPLAMMAIFVTGLLLLSTGASAWHMSNENENKKFTSLAGDERVKTDGAGCIEAVGHSLEGQTKAHCIVLYAHNYDLLNAVPMNIQRPPECFPNLAQGFTGTPGIEPFWEFSRALLYSSPGFVEYDEARCEERPRIHPERGLTSDIVISRDTDILGYWYLSVDTLEFSPLGIGTGEESATPSFGVMPCLTVEMVLQVGRFMGAGSVLASGTTTKTIVSTPAEAGSDLPEIPADPCPESEGTIQPEQVTEFEVNLGKAEGRIPEHQGYLVYVLWYQHSPTGDYREKENIVQREWNRHNGADFPNRVLLPVEESIRVERVRPQEFDGKIYIHTVLNSPWGSYDVDTRNIRVEVFTEAGEKVDIKHLADPVLRYSVDHDGHFKPVNATFPWDYKQEGLADGRYTVKVTVPNWQHTAEAYRSANFVLSGDTVEEEDENGNRPTQPDLDEEAPIGAALLTALALLGLAGVAVMRRRE